MKTRKRKAGKNIPVEEYIKAAKKGNRLAEQELLGPGFHASDRAYRSGYRHVNSQLVRIENPFGTRTAVELSDGSRAMLHAGTVLSYPSAFTGHEKNVTVTGEVFFEVQSDKRQPFVVGAGDIRVRVFGAKFNVKAYDEEEAVEVTLEEGSVGAALPGARSFVKIKPGE